MKRNKLLKSTSSRRIYHILNVVDGDPYCECCCPMWIWNYCKRHKHFKCRPNRVRERNWKSQRKTHWKIAK